MFNRQEKVTIVSKANDVLKWPFKPKKLNKPNGNLGQGVLSLKF